MNPGKRNDGVTVVIPSLQRPSLITALSSVACEPGVAGVYVVTGRNTSEQRNAGAAGAATDYLLFMDDDCVAAPGAIKAALDYMREERLDALAPKIEGGIVSSPTCVFAGAAIFAKRELAQAVPFDREIRGCEDLDWAWRIMKRRAQWRYWPGAVFYHVGPTQTPDVFSESAQRDGWARLEAKHPKRFAWLRDHDSSVLGLKPAKTDDLTPFARYQQS